MEAKTCPACGRRVLDANQDCGLPVLLDPRPLGREGEAFALLAGRVTFAIHLWGGYSISRRNHFEIRGSPAGSERRTDIVVEHDCQAEELPHIRSKLQFVKSTTDNLVEPPF